MSIASYCRKAPCTARSDETLRAAAQRMEKEGIGLLVVTEDDRLAGVLTDRDIALHVVAEGRDPGVERIADAMSRPPTTVGLEDAVEDAIDRMAAAHVRRLPVVDAERVEGVVSLDDLVLLLAREIGGLGEVLVAQLPAGASRARGSKAAPSHAARPVEHYRRDVVTLPATDPIGRVAQEMRDRAVGSVVLLAADGKATGLVTDRDVALRVVAAGLDPVATAASAIMSTPLTAADPAEPLEQVIARMRTAGVRRIPVLRDGQPVGIVSFDDLLVAFGRELDRLGECVSREIRRARTRSLPARVRLDLEDRLEDAAARLRTVGDHTLRTLGRELDQAIERLSHAIRGGSEPARIAPPRVRDVMRSDIRTCTPDAALSEAARIMWERDCGCVPVVAGDGSNRVVGMITDRDICMATYTSGAPLSQAQVESAMARRVHVCHPDDPLSEAEALMRSAQVRRLPVVDETGHLRGLLSLADIAEAAAGVRVTPGMVSATEVGVVLEGICHPHSELVRR